MTTSFARPVPAFDPFGEPIDSSRACADAKVLGADTGYGETRRAAMIFWVLVILFVGGRICLSERPLPQAAIAEAAPVTAQVTTLR